MDYFAAIVAGYLRERGVSVRGLARSIGRSDSYTGRVISGERPRGADIARRIDIALEAGGDIAAAASRPVPQPAEDMTVPQELIADFAIQLASQYRTDRHLGAGRIIPVAREQYRVIEGVAETVQGTDRAAVEGIAAGFAGLLAWLHQDKGNLADSVRWHDVMIAHAQRSGDEQLSAFALQAKAFLFADMGDAAAVLDLTGQALEGRSRLAPRVMVHLLQQRAHGVTLAGGDPGEALRLLDEADGFMDGADDGSPWGSAVTSPRWLDVQRATVCTRLGRASEALDLWNDILPAVTPGRDWGVFMTRRAQSLAAADEPDEAVAVARQVIPMARRTGSARMRGELGRLQDRMVPWEHQRPGRQLREALAGLRRGR